MTFLARLRRWWRSRRDETDRIITVSAALNERQERLIETTDNWLAQRYTGRWEGNRHD